MRRSGNVIPNSIYEPKVFSTMRSPGIKVFEKFPPVPINAASHAMFGKVGWWPVP